jgi:hypothetical protein
LSRNDYTERAPSGYPADIAAQSNIATVAAESQIHRALHSETNNKDADSNEAVGVNTAIPSNFQAQQAEDDENSDYADEEPTPNDSMDEADEADEVEDDETPPEEVEEAEEEEESECVLSK